VELSPGLWQDHFWILNQTADETTRSERFHGQRAAAAFHCLTEIFETQNPCDQELHVSRTYPDYAERHRAGLRVGSAITEGTANFLAAIIHQPGAIPC